MKVTLDPILPPAPPPPKRYRLQLDVDYAELCVLLRLFGRAGGCQEISDIVGPVYALIRAQHPQVGYDADRFTFHPNEHTIRFIDAPEILKDLRAKHP